MRVLLIGGGGRECALGWRIAQSGSLTNLWCSHPNPGWPESAEVRPASTVAEQVQLAQSLGVDLVVAGPEGPLSQGLADHLEALGIPCFGPSQAAAQLETSKAFTKEIAQQLGIPTAQALVIARGDVSGWEAAKARCAKGRVVLKADGLAAGKGVVVCHTAAEAQAALTEMERFGQASARLLLEDLLEGPEVSLFALSDGARCVALPSSQDHKTLRDGGEGPNTGGMGAYAPCPLVDNAQGEHLVAAVHQRIVDELRHRGTPFRGVLYGGFMLTADGPYLLEFNVRFGDPECQPLMALWDDDILAWLHGAACGALPVGAPRFSKAAACCVVLASAGYPMSSDKGREIPEPPPREGVVVFHAGTVRGGDGVLRTNGGRVLGITGVGTDLAEARTRAYAAVDGWRFAGAQVRLDIGVAGLKR